MTKYSNCSVEDCRKRLDNLNSRTLRKKNFVKLETINKANSLKAIHDCILKPGDTVCIRNFIFYFILYYPLKNKFHLCLYKGCYKGILPNLRKKKIKEEELKNMVN
jgi:hypothetical protein